MRHRIIAVVVLGLAVGGALVSCGGDDGEAVGDGVSAEPTEQPAASVEAIEGPNWLLESIESGGTASPAPAGAAQPPSLRLDAGQLSGHDGCNGFGGPYTVEPEGAGFRLAAPDLLSTLIGCASDSSAAGLLGAAMNGLLVLTGPDTLELVGAAETYVFRSQA
jgi:heat shock protein HslJ